MKCEWRRWSNEVWVAHYCASSTLQSPQHFRVRIQNTSVLQCIKLAPQHFLDWRSVKGILQIFEDTVKRPHDVLTHHPFSRVILFVCLKQKRSKILRLCKYHSHQAAIVVRDFFYRCFHVCRPWLVRGLCTYVHFASNCSQLKCFRASARVWITRTDQNVGTSPIKMT